MATVSEQGEPTQVSVSFKAPDGKSNLKFLDKLCRGGIIERFTKAKLDEEYGSRLAQEMHFWTNHENGLNKLLIVWDCLYWARGRHIKIVDVKGALEGLFTAYLLEITQTDPVLGKLKFDEIAAEQILPITIFVSSLAELNSLQTYINSRYVEAGRPLVKIGSSRSDF